MGIDIKKYSGKLVNFSKLNVRQEYEEEEKNRFYKFARRGKPAATVGTMTPSTSQKSNRGYYRAIEVTVDDGVSSSGPHQH